MATFEEMVARIARELRRSNIEVDIRLAINDAIDEAKDNRFYLNEVRGQTFPTVASQEYYDDLGIQEVDVMYFYIGTARYEVYCMSNYDMDQMAVNTVPGGIPLNYSRHGGQFRIYPIPSAVTTIYVDGYGRLLPWPMITGSATNAWLTEGERYIRALAKRNLLINVIKDYSEGKVQDTIADVEMSNLLARTNMRNSDNTIRATQF